MSASASASNRYVADAMPRPSAKPREPFANADSHGPTADDYRAREASGSIGCSAGTSSCGSVPRRRAMGHRRREPLGRIAPPHPFHGGQTHLQRLGDAPIRPRRARRPLIGLQEDARMCQLPSRSGPGGDEPLQRATLIIGQVDAMLFLHTPKRAAGHDTRPSRPCQPMSPSHHNSSQNVSLTRILNGHWQRSSHPPIA